MVSDILWKCQRDNGITIPQVTGHYYILSSCLFISISWVEKFIPHWQEKRWAALQLETTPTKGEVPFFCAGEICHLFLGWSQCASKSCPPFMCKSKRFLQGFVFPWALFRIAQAAKYIMALSVFPCKVSASFYTEKMNKTPAKQACSWVTQISCTEQLFSALCNTSQIQKRSKPPATAGKHAPNGKLKIISILYMCLITSTLRSSLHTHQDGIWMQFMHQWLY